MACEKIKIYNSDSRRNCQNYEYPDEMSDCDEIRKHQGFAYKQKVADPFFVEPENGIPFFGITIYRNDYGESICEFWDYKEELFKFFCYNEQDTFQVIREFVKLAKDFSQIELNIKELSKENEVK